MEIVEIIIGYLFFQFDITLLKKRALPLFEKVFCFSVWQVLSGALLLVLAVLKTGEHGFDILKIILIVLLMIYLLRRGQFMAMVKASPEYAVVENETLELALDTFSILAFWVLGMVLMGAAVDLSQFFLHQKTDELASLLMFSAISSVLLIFLVYRAVAPRKELNLFQVLGLETKGLGWIKIWALPACFALAYALGTSFLLAARPIQPMTPLQELLNSTSSLGAIIFFVGAAVLTAPFFEEIIFRGFFFYVIKPFKGIVFAVIFVALIFWFLHVDQYWGDWDALTVVGLFGLSLTLLRAWTGSSVPGMIAHYVYNTSLTVIPVLAILFANPLYLEYELNSARMTAHQKEEILLKSISQYPEFSNAYNDLAWLYSEQSIKLDRALEFIDKALAHEPGNYAFWDTKAEVLFKMRRVSEAIAIEKDLIKEYPKNPYLKDQLKKFQSVYSRGALTDI